MSKVYEAFGTVSTDVSAKGSTPTAAVKALREDHSTSPEWIQPVGDPDAGFDVAGVCEGCEVPIRHDTNYHSDNDDIMTCETCAADMPVIVMVLDLGGDKFSVRWKDRSAVFAELENAFEDASDSEYKVRFTEMSREACAALPEFEGF